MRKFILVTALVLFAATLNAQTSEQLWSELMAGNRLFVDGQVVYGSLRSARSTWATSQKPPVGILSCADSRVPAEIIFGRTVGEMFVVRVAGNVEDPFGVASLEYAAMVPRQWLKLIVVMGHSDCGAVSSSLAEPPKDRPTKDLYALIMRIRKSFTPTPPPNPTNLRNATIMNINYTAAQLRANTILKNVPIIKAYYDVASGKVERIP